MALQVQAAVQAFEAVQAAGNAGRAPPKAAGTAAAGTDTLNSASNSSEAQQLPSLVAPQLQTENALSPPFSGQARATDTAAALCGIAAAAVSEDTISPQQHDDALMQAIDRLEAAGSIKCFIEYCIASNIASNITFNVLCSFVCEQEARQELK